VAVLPPSSYPSQLVVEDIVGKDGALIAARDESDVRRPQKERAPGRACKATKRMGNRESSNGAKRAKNMGLTRETTIPPTRDMDTSEDVQEDEERDVGLRRFCGKDEAEGGA